MATPRLPFLCPNLMRAARSYESTTYRSLRLTAAPRSGFHTTRRRYQETYQRRYGPAVEPNIPPPSRPKDHSSAEPVEGTLIGKEQSENTERDTSVEEDLPRLPQSPEEVQADGAEADASPAVEQATIDSITTDSASAEPDESEGHPVEIDTTDNFNSSSTSSSADVEEEMSQMPPYANRSAFEEVYHMPSPSTGLTATEPFTSNRPPHLSPAPYVHHFDTYSLVLDLSKGGYTNEQSVTIMKAVRNILQNNIDFAKQSLTSKSDVENEEYLFKAACSELQQSLQTARNSEVQRQRASRTQLEHETDILSQRLTQELSGMKDDIKGMFNDHKMSTREQQRSIDTMVQELNYKITVSLNSDGKSEIEGLRWVLTRRAALTVATCAFMIIVFIKYASTRKTPEPKQVKEVDQPVVKETVKETRVVHDVGAQTDTPSIPESHLGESLG